MNDALVMQIFHGSHQFCGVELCAVYGFCCQLGNELEQVSILGIGENKVQPLRVLEFGKKGKYIVCWLFIVQIHFIGA